jgi:hypothetical protein
MAWSRDELERAFTDYQAAGAEAGRTGDWSKWPDIFTEDCEYIEHMYGVFHGREAVREWITKTMGDYPGNLMHEFPINWYVVDDDRGWIVCEVANRMEDPGDGSIHDGVNITILKYAGHGLWQSEEDVYNPAHFGTMLKGWEAAKRAASPQ